MLSLEKEISTLRTEVAFIVRDEIKTLKLSGPDRVRFLNGMVTNDVSKLSDEQALWAVKTNNRGRTEGLLRMRLDGEAILLDVDESVSKRVLSVLDQYIIMDDCEIIDISDSRKVMSVIGPKAAQILEEHGVSIPNAKKADGAISRTDSTVAIVDRSFGPWGYELHLDESRANELAKAMAEAGVHCSSPKAVEVLRVESGCVRNAIDLDEDTIPMEARLEYAIDFEKGCYVGQEVIARATNLGQVNYLLVGVRFDDDIQGGTFAGSDLLLPETEKVVGEVNSIVYSPTLGAWIGLAYIHRKYETVGVKLTCRAPDDTSETSTLTVLSLPFVEVGVS